jgi:H+/gluconate symporter-like permease
MLDTGYLADPRFGATTLDRVQGPVVGDRRTGAGGGLLLALGWRRLADPVETLGKGAETALKPLFNTAVLVGFGAVIASLPGFAALRAGLEGLSGGDVLVSLALATNVLAGITGSASGGLSIALDTLGAGYLAQAQAQGIDPQVLHRIAAVATGGLDALPHNGAVVTLLGICGMTHRQAYPDIFVVACAIPLLALAVMIGLAGFGIV